MLKQDFIIVELETQRNNALNTVCLLSAELSMARARIAELEKQVVEAGDNNQESSP